MPQRFIYESDAKELIATTLPEYMTDFVYHGKCVVVEEGVDFGQLTKDNPWLKTDKLIVKPDQLFGKRGKAGLILLDVDYKDAWKFLKENLGKTITMGQSTGVLKRFLIEPFIEHHEEYYISFVTRRNHDTVRFSTKGGIDIEKNWEEMKQINIPIGADIDSVNFTPLFSNLAGSTELLSKFVKGLANVFIDQDFTFLEANPFVIDRNGQIVPLDIKAKLDDTAWFLHQDTWGSQKKPIPFPSAFGQHTQEEEKKIKEIDEQTGASLKLKILNPDGRIWTMVAGGGASVIYTDTIVDLGHEKELANYGEYSGNPNRDHVRLYAKTILDLMIKKRDSEGRPKILLIGGGIANFTDVRETFLGIIDAIRESVDKLRRIDTRIFVRRGGLNEEDGLKSMRKLGEELNIPIKVFDRHTHMTRIVRLAFEEA